MLFKNIEVCNFGRYAGKENFNTTVTPDRNVILVKAKNDRGKTTLFKAIKFALYGNEGLRPKSASEWINFQKASEGDGEMYVEIKFDHEGDEYRLKRLIKFKKTERGKEISTMGAEPVIELFQNGNPYMAGDQDGTKRDWIDTILPKDASQFFFFDGEEIQRYIQNEEAHVRQAIEKVIGIKELLNAKDDLLQVSGRFQSEYEKNIRKHTKDKKSQDELLEIGERINEINENIKMEEKIRNGAEDAKLQLDREQKKYEAIKSVVEERDDVDGEIKQLRQTLKDHRKNLAVSRGNAGLVLLTPLLRLIDRTEEDPPTVDRWQSDTIKYIMENLDQCICGRPIDQHVKELFESRILDMTPSKISMLKRMVNRILIDHTPDTKWLTLKKHLEDEASFMQELDKQKSSFERLNKEIRGGEGLESIKELQDKFEEAVKDIGNAEKRIEQYQEERNHVENQKKKIESKINSNVVDEQLSRAESRRDVCEKVLDCIDQSIERFYEKRKPILEEHISGIFASLTNNPDMYRGLKIDRDFSMKVVRKDGTELPTYKYSPSAGASQIVATSMIGGLNKFATRDAPVVIDTPMGRLDPDHRKNLIRYYSKMSKQIIILYQPSELDDGDIQHIVDNIASEWSIESTPDQPDLSRLCKENSHYV